MNSLLSWLFGGSGSGDAAGGDWGSNTPYGTGTIPAGQLGAPGAAAAQPGGLAGLLNPQNSQSQMGALAQQLLAGPQQVAPSAQALGARGGGMGGMGGGMRPPTWNPQPVPSFGALTAPQAGAAGAPAANANTGSSPGNPLNALMFLRMLGQV
jgi:hypothetical protein